MDTGVVVGTREIYSARNKILVKPLHRSVMAAMCAVNPTLKNSIACNLFDMGPHTISK